MMNDPRTLDDEAIDEALRAGDYSVAAEASRRAEIRIDRIYFGADYGFTEANVIQKHDASWYESRQTEEQFLAEVGAD